MSLRELVENGLWEEAVSSLLVYMQEEKLDVEKCIIGATVMEHFANYDGMKSLIYTGLKMEPDNYELYLLLGNYYLGVNDKLSYLCFENALYLAEKSGNSDDILQIKEIFDSYKEDQKIAVNNVTIVILSHNTLDYTRKCIESIRECCRKESCEIVVVENASTDGSIEYLRRQEDIILLENKENVGFPAGCNQGIRAGNSNNDILLLNSDTLMMPNSLFLLRMGLYENEKNGASGAATNYAGNRQMIPFKGKDLEDYLEYAKRNNVPKDNALEIKNMLIMFAMLIKRDVLNIVGELDEQFSPGNYEDNDYGIRLLKSGYQCVLCWNSYIHHFGSKSFGKNAKEYYSLLARNHELLEKKVDFEFAHYLSETIDCVRLMDKADEDTISVLEVGCGLGELLSNIMYKYPGAKVSGIEPDRKVAEIANSKFNIRCIDIEREDILEEEKYDYIIFEGALETLYDPKKVLKKISNNLKENASVLASVSNLMHVDVIQELLQGRFTYDTDGTMDKKHIRFFTRDEIIRLFNDAGYDIESLQGVMESGNTQFLDALMGVENIAERHLFEVKRYLVKAKIKH